jgi:hypothetical protein
MNKKVVAAVVAVAGFLAITALGYKSLENLDKLDLTDPFEVDFDDE